VTEERIRIAAGLRGSWDGWFDHRLAQHFRWDDRIRSLGWITCIDISACEPAASTSEHSAYLLYLSL
jgi:hypothetical protein